MYMDILNYWLYGFPYIFPIDFSNDPNKIAPGATRGAPAAAPVDGAPFAAGAGRSGPRKAHGKTIGTP